MHNPTNLNRQGPDVGSQYRSAIFYHDQQQKMIATESKKLIGNLYSPKSIVTEITETSTFYPAEEYHQCYLEKKGVTHCS